MRRFASVAKNSCHRAISRRLTMAGRIVNRIAPRVSLVACNPNLRRKFVAVAIAAAAVPITAVSTTKPPTMRVRFGFLMKSQ